jgi:Lrp/AsnC family leucine-responsive transcriptional regulator
MKESSDHDLDRIDLKMLRALQRDGRISNADLAAEVGVSAATCHRRTQQLIEAGYISGFRAMVAPHQVELGTLVLVGVVLDRSTPESFAAFESAAAKLKFVLDCHLVAGDFDYGARHGRFQPPARHATDRVARGTADPNLLRDEGGGGRAGAGVLSGTPASFPLA